MSKNIEEDVKIVGLVPFWIDKENSVDLKKIAGKYLIEYTVELLNSSPLIQETVVYSSSKEVMKYISKNLDIKYLNRPKSLDNEEACLEEIISQFLKDYDFDILVLMRPFCPFVKRETIDECINKVRTGGNDSAYTALEFKKFAWFKGRPLNFDLRKFSQKMKYIDEVIVEQGLTHIISKESFIKNKNRIGVSPFVKIIKHFEGHEVEDDHDYEIAELIVNSGMYKGPCS